MELEHNSGMSRLSLTDNSIEGRTTMFDDPPPPVLREDSRPRDRGALIQMNGLEAGRLYLLADAVTLGRGRHCNLRFDDATLSRIHARVIRRGEDYFLEDAGSLNGCFVNDRRMQRARLVNGDRVRLASGASLRFQIVDEEEEKSLTRLYDSSTRDGLTGALNRKYLEERLSAEVAYAARHRTELSVVMLDIDHFKRINDSRGHLAGDAVLQHIAKLISSVLRAEDVLARYGGEELVAVARGISVTDAAMLAERLRVSVEQTESPFEGVPIRATMSAGVASLACCAGGRAPKDLIARADARLYQAKARGRNRVIAGDAA
jgi:diguanylate cyclase (GGDEF)-like protein